MRHIKKFEELDFNQTIAQTTVSELTNYYSCDECNALFKFFNKRSNHCLYCNSKNISSVGFDKFYDEASKRLEPDEREDLEFAKSQELNTYVNLEALPYSNMSESVGEDKGIIRRGIESIMSILLFPLGVPLIANLNTDYKVSIIKKIIIENYILEKIEYDILDEVKYDIKQPSKLDKVFRRLKLIKKKMKKYPTLDDIISRWEKIFRSYNIVNVRNRRDIDYLVDEVKDFFGRKTEKEWMDSFRINLNFDPIKNKVIDDKKWTWIINFSAEDIRMGQRVN